MEAHAIPVRPLVRRASPRHAVLSDERLAHLVATGDERAFVTLYERYHQQLYRYCRSMLRHEADAQDAMQSAMTSAYTALGRSQRDAPVRPWLFRIAHNEAISVLRRRRPGVELSEAVGGVAPSAEAQGAARARLELLVADLLELPERQRGALVMRELSGLSHEDIATALGTSVGAAKQAIFEARRALQDFEEGRAMSCDEVCRTISDADGRALRGRRVRAHLRDCAACSAFAAGIGERTANLRALAPPLSAVTAAGLLSQVLGGGGSTGGGAYAAGAGGAGFAGAATGKAALTGLSAKAIAGLAVLSAGTVAVTNVVTQNHTSKPPPPAAMALQRGASPSVSGPARSSSATPAAATTTRPTSSPTAPAARETTTAGPGAPSWAARPDTVPPTRGLALGRTTTPGAGRSNAPAATGTAPGSGISSTARESGGLGTTRSTVRQQPPQAQQPPSSSSTTATSSSSTTGGAHASATGRRMQQLTDHLITP